MNDSKNTGNLASPLPDLPYGTYLSLRGPTVRMTVIPRTHIKRYYPEDVSDNFARKVDKHKGIGIFVLSSDNTITGRYEERYGVYATSSSEDPRTNADFLYLGDPDIDVQITQIRQRQGDIWMTSKAGFFNDGMFAFHRGQPYLLDSIPMYTI